MEVAMELLLSQAWGGYLINAEARSLSQNTINDYGRTFERFLKWRGDVTVDQVTKSDIERFMRSLNGLSKKTKLNYHIGLSALWTWLIDEQLIEVHIVRQVKAPKPAEPEVVPFTEQDVQLLLASVEMSKPYKRLGQLEPCSHSNPNALRNRTIIYVLLDTGMRASELCALTVKDVDLRNREIEIIEGKGGNRGRSIAPPKQRSWCGGTWPPGRQRAITTHSLPVEVSYT
jgi:site-specific recombinase XerD